MAFSTLDPLQREYTYLFFVLGLYLFGFFFPATVTLFWIANRLSSQAILYPQSASDFLELFHPVVLPSIQSASPSSAVSEEPAMCQVPCDGLRVQKWLAHSPDLPEHHTQISTGMYRVSTPQCGKWDIWATSSPKREASGGLSLEGQIRVIWTEMREWSRLMKGINTRESGMIHWLIGAYCNRTVTFRQEMVSLAPEGRPMSTVALAPVTNFGSRDSRSRYSRPVIHGPIIHRSYVL